ncbi:MAG: coenzyme F420 hydrogenase/dehydrogenase beta subunit N-terminal domain-containing protein [Desulfobia sp.]
MKEMAEQIRTRARELLSQGRVDCVIGYRKGSVPMQEQPFIAYTPEEADQLTWSVFCTSNLANFLIKRPGKKAVVAQGCISRSIVGLIKENQVNREDVYILGVHSPGMVDAGKVRDRFPDRVLHQVYLEGEDLVVKGRDFTERVPHKEVKRNNCYTCTHRNAVIYDEFIGEKGQETGGGNIDKVAAPWDRLEPGQRWEKFTSNFKDCIRCYACRNVCPLCYCDVCFVDEHNPQWCGKGQEETDIYTFHILRAFHCAGRCTDCGACESACPVGIKMRALTSKLEFDVRQNYDYSPGLDMESIPPLSNYKKDDPEIN